MGIIEIIEAQFLLVAENMLPAGKTCRKCTNSVWFTSDCAGGWGAGRGRRFGEQGRGQTMEELVRPIKDVELYDMGQCFTIFPFLPQY